MQKLPFKGKLLICDMDGTLLNTKSLISPENREALFRFTDGGGLFTVATGRYARSVERYIGDLPINVPAILYNGAVIYDFAEGKILWQNPLPEIAREIALNIEDSFPEAGMQLYHGPDIFYARQSDETREHMKREKITPKFYRIEEVPMPWLKILIAWKPELLYKVEELLQDYIEYVDYVRSEPQFLEILNKGVSKGNALNRLRRLLKGRFEFDVCIGDNLNDMELIREATFGIAVGNAHESLKCIANKCCCTNDENAAAEVIRWLEEGYFENMSNPENSNV